LEQRGHCPARAGLLPSSPTLPIHAKGRLAMYPRVVNVAIFLAFVSTLRAADDYKLGPDSERKSGVPQGNVTQHKWTSKVFPGTERDYWVYVPAQYDGKSPACVMVFQDGGNYQNEKGQFRVPIVLDNLINRHELPVMIGIFVNPGVVPSVEGQGQGRSNRSFEYDTLSPQYVTFLEKEILPEVGKEYKLRQEAAGRAIGGSARAESAPSLRPGSGRICSRRC